MTLLQYCTDCSLCGVQIATHDNLQGARDRINWLALKRYCSKYCKKSKVLTAKSTRTFQCANPEGSYCVKFDLNVTPGACRTHARLVQAAEKEMDRRVTDFLLRYAKQEQRYWARFEQSLMDCGWSSNRVALYKDYCYDKTRPVFERFDRVQDPPAAQIRKALIHLSLKEPELTAVLSCPSCWPQSE
ncbi:hypothetical protein ACM66B_004139 [Microbotryomycetes sp. NB124-2]